MFNTLLTPEMAPFTLALILLFALVALELVFMFIGLSLVGDAGDLDMDVADVPDVADLGDLGVDMDLPDAADYDIPDMADATDASDVIDGSDPGVLAWLGMGKVPFIIWLGTMLFSFGVSGLLMQSIITLPAMLVAVPALVAAIWFTKTFSAGFVAVLPKSETSAMDTKRFGGYRGTVTQGTARRGHPAEVRVTDRFGNTHYLRAEPAKDEDKIRQGTDVIILRNIRTGQMRLLPVG